MSQWYATTSSSGEVLSYPMVVARNYVTCRDTVVVKERFHCHNYVSSVPEDGKVVFPDVRSKAMDDARHNSKAKGAVSQLRVGVWR